MRSPLLLGYLALFGFDRLLGGGVDPPRVQTERIFGGSRRSPELVPRGHTERREVVMRDHVVSILQHAVERAGMGDEARPIRRADQLLDQLIDDLALDPEQVAAALLVG